MDVVYQELEALVALARDRKATHKRLPGPTQRRAIRLRASLSQAELARVLNVSRQAVARWETGDREPSTENLSTYVALLGRLAADFGQEVVEEWSNDS